jgi:hypothetical protein
LPPEFLCALTDFLLVVHQVRVSVNDLASRRHAANGPPLIEHSLVCAKISAGRFVRVVLSPEN